MGVDWVGFCGRGVDSEIPDHRVLSKARRRWGLDLFQKLFGRVLEACDRAGLVEGQTAHADSTLLKANADREGRVSRKLWEQLESGLDAEAPADDEPPDGPRGLAIAGEEPTPGAAASP